MIDLHTNVYPRKPVGGQAGKRSRECNEAGAGVGGAASGTPDLRHDSSSSRHRCGVNVSGHSAGSNSTDTSDGAGRARKPDKSVAAFDEELRRFACAHGKGDKDCLSPSGREFVFADLVRDSRVLEAARTLAAAAGGAEVADAAGVKASGDDVNAAGAGKVSEPGSGGGPRDCRSSCVASAEGGLFQLRAAITHGISRLRNKGWLVLADQERDVYIYVFPPPPPRPVTISLLSRGWLRAM